MDIKKTGKNTRLFNLSKTNMLWALGGTAVILSFWMINKEVTLSVDRKDLLIEAVQQGDLEVLIEGYGALISNKQRLITSSSSATVKEIILKPGAEVRAGSVIVRLENPELVQQFENTEQQLAQEQANLRQLNLNNRREKLTESANLAELSARYDTAMLKRTAEEQLVERGIVSKLSYEQTILDEKQLKKRIHILRERITQLELVHKESINIQKERVKQEKGRLAVAQNRLDKLTVKAGLDGVLQRLSVELGQSLSSGQEIALIGSVTDLNALIRVPQSQVQFVTIGKPAVIDTRRGKVEGRVVRIDPIVENNTVNIEIDLPKILPASARPQLSVNGVIVVNTLKNVMYIKRPAGAKSNTMTSLYRVNSTEENAQMTNIHFGAQAGQLIQIVSGAMTGEQFIISDLSNLHATSKILKIN